MSRNCNGCNSHVAILEGLAVGKYDIFARPCRIGVRICRWVRRIHQVPVCRCGCDLRAVMILEILRAAEMICMTMAKQDVFHLGWIESKFLHSRDDFGLGFISEPGIEQDNPAR